MSEQRDIRKMKLYNCVLIIDDDTISSFANKFLLERMGIAKMVVVVNNGLIALDFLKNYCKNNEGNCPELILLDLKMPVMDGFEFLEKFKELTITNKEKVKTLVLTSSEDLLDLRRIQEYNLSGYIVKPLTLKKMLTLTLN